MADEKPKVHLIVSDDEHPKVETPAGKKLQVIGVSLVDAKLGKAKVTAARLCGGTSSCQALFEA